MRCKECGFNKRGKKHTSGYQHRNVIRKRGVLRRDDKGNLEKRIEKRLKPLEVEDENTN